MIACMNRESPNRQHIRPGSTLRIGHTIIAGVLMALAAPVLAQGSAGDRDARRAKAIANCEANRGVDCRSEAGLREWELLERSRAEAVRDGSRRAPPPQPAKPKQGTTGSTTGSTAGSTGGTAR